MFNYVRETARFKSETRSTMERVLVLLLFIMLGGSAYFERRRLDILKPELMTLTMRAHESAYRVDPLECAVKRDFSLKTYLYCN